MVAVTIGLSALVQMGFFHANKEVVIRMASRIAGITVEIGGDTTKLSKALEGVNKSIKTTQSELKDVNKLLKLDPSNTEAVTQKQRMLKEAIEATKEKLTILKTAAQQANEQLADGKITQEQYDALQREIVETEEQLKSLQEQTAVTNATLAKIDAVGDKLQSDIDNISTDNYSTMPKNQNLITKKLESPCAQYTKKRSGPQAFLFT